MAKWGKRKSIPKDDAKRIARQQREVERARIAWRWEDAIFNLLIVSPNATPEEIEKQTDVTVMAAMVYMRAIADANKSQEAKDD